MSNRIVSTTLLFTAFLYLGLVSFISSADSSMTCEEIEPDFYRCVVHSSCSNEFRWSAPDDILVYPAGGVGSTMGLIRDRDIGGCVVATATSLNGRGSVAYSTCGGGRQMGGNNCGDPPTGSSSSSSSGSSSSSSSGSGPVPMVTCEEEEPDFYRCVAHHMGSGNVRWSAPDDILVYPDGGLGSTMALIQDRDVGGCIVATAQPVDGSRGASYTTCGGGRHIPSINRSRRSTRANDMRESNSVSGAGGVRSRSRR